MESACVSALNPLQTACPLERVWLASSNTCIDLLTTVVERISPVLAADNSISCMRSRVCILYCIHQFPAIVCSSESMLCIDSRRAFDHTADAEIEYGMSAPCSHKALNACRNAKIPPFGKSSHAAILPVATHGAIERLHDDHRQEHFAAHGSLLARIASISAAAASRRRKKKLMGERCARPSSSASGLSICFCRSHRDRALTSHIFLSSKDDPG
ncbi:uncharacterized protein K489DRAFT_419571 [Dissoconium aciculare CBS 342.82]|uniref:Uncharacterized protein n=1 Tax=Dissoconium aciculare CBS 342.82 TaxID=1314786 RepID=A0A6J3MEK8_9PEZI|nr:uncharacterized protein K489DRAFT_419571 [Dissoconium aciculare CBS 342.82]KAF1826318.1 hypothetical protein K489DRAFT_419571 [Dissoconium aciculare CBS 342.82]